MLTPEQIEAACDNLKKSLLDAHQRGIEVSWAQKPSYRYVYSAEMYGAAPADAELTGMTFTIEIGVPAEKSRRQDEAGVVRLRRRLEGGK